MVLTIFEFFEQIINGVSDAFSSLASQITTAFSDSLIALTEMYNQLLSMQTNLDNITSDILSGASGNISVFEMISVYRYIVGSVIFQYQYIAILLGAMFLVFKLVIVIESEIRNALTANASKGVVASLKK